MQKLRNQFIKLREEMFEEFSENKGNEKELEEISCDYIKMIQKNIDSIRDLSILFTDSEQKELIKYLSQSRTIAIFKYTKEVYEEIFEV